MGDEGQRNKRNRLRLSAVWKRNDEEQKESKMPIGKVLSGKGVNKKSVMATIRNGWNLGEETEIVEMNEYAFVFTFSKMKDKHRLLRGRPWMIQGSLMSIQEWSEYMVFEEVSFDKNPFWVQFHNMPLGLLEEEVNIQNMGNLVGELLWYEKPKVKDKFNRGFGRARVLVDINKPLVAGFWVDRPDNSEIWMSVKYERLQSFCYKCGIIGHNFKGCNRNIVTDEKGNRVYGSWLMTNAERDNDEAMVKFSASWKEEDCRALEQERAINAPVEREGRRETIRYIEISKPAIATPEEQDSSADKNGALQATSSLVTWDESVNQGEKGRSQEV